MKRFRLLIVLIGVAAVTAGGVVLVPVTASAAGPTYVDVSSTQGWQQTPVTLHRGDKVSLWYETGSWSVDHVNFPYVGPGGYSSAVDQKIYQGCKLNPNWVYGLMLGRIGNGPTMVVGKSATLTADRDGPLELRIHDGDACLGDNAGAIRMEYSVQAAPPATPKSCPTVLLGLHGMNEGPSTTKTADPKDTVESTFTSFKNSPAAKAHGPNHYRVQDVSYPTTGFFELGNPVKMRTILSDVVDGSFALEAAVKKYTAACHSKRVRTSGLLGRSLGSPVLAALPRKGSERQGCPVVR